MEKVDYRTSLTITDASNLDQLTRAERVNAIASTIIAFATVVGLMGGLYVNLNASSVGFFKIFIFEIILVLIIVSMIDWLRHYMKPW